VWGELIAAAQAVIDHYEEFPAADIRSLYEEKSAIPLIAAARILDSASKAADIPDADRHKLAIAATVAFGMYGNSLSAAAAARRVIAMEDGGDHALARTVLLPRGSDGEKEEAVSLKDTLAVALATAAPQVLGKVQPWCKEGSPQYAYLERLGQYLRTGQSDQVHFLRQALVDCLLAEDAPFAGMLLFASRLCLEHVIVLSTAAVIAAEWPACPPGYVRRLVDAGVQMFLPPQYKAVVEKQLLSTTGNMLIALPTSAGKTLLGELRLISALGDRPGLACYLAPYVALGQQVADTLRRHLPKRYRIHPLVGGHKGEVKLEPKTYREVVVATPERLDLLLRSMPEIAESIRCVVCDEAHMIPNDTRGMKLEGLLSRIRMRQQRGSPLQVVLISAVLPEYEPLRLWMSIEETNVITDTWRPTARRLAIWRQSGQLTWHLGPDPVRMAGASNDDVLGISNLLWPKTHFYGSDKPGAIVKQEADLFENVAYLVDTVHHQYNGGPILCYCASRHNSRKLAAAIASRMEKLEPLPPAIASTIALIARKHKILRPLMAMLRKGVAYHNASLPHDVRSHLEEAIKQQEIIAVTATTTLAEGVDLPFRFTILADWLTWGESQKQRPMEPLLFRNIAGRCGRAGVMTEGDTIIFDNPVGDLTYTNPYNRQVTLLDSYVNRVQGTLRSALATVSLGTDAYEACLGELDSQFLAAVPENPDDDNLVSTFATNLFSALDNDVSARVLRRLEATRASIIDPSREALATAASPLTLTPFGHAALCTSFSPNSCRTILKCLKDAEPDTTPAGLGHYLLTKLGTLPEQYHEKLRKILGGKRNNQFQVKVEDVPELVRNWLSGLPIDEMFLSLPVLARSSKTPKVGVWAAGVDEPTVWDDDFDKFCDVIKQVLCDYMPWLMFACKQLSTIAEGWSENVKWDTYSSYFELGVDSLWAVRVLRTNAPVERHAAAIIGRRIPDTWLTDSDQLGLRGLRDNQSRFRQFETIAEESIEEASGEETETGAGLRMLYNLILDRIQMAE
jgi:helicase